MPSEDGDNDAQVNDIEERLTVVEAYQENIVGGQIMDRLEDVESKFSELAELREENEQLRAMVQDLQGQMETVAGLAEDQQTTPEKRAADVRMALIRRAKARSDGEDKAAMHYKEVQKALADLGHGQVWKQQAFDAMDDAAGAAGFEMAAKNKGGNDVKAVRVDLESLPAHVASNEITTSGGAAGAQNTPNTAD